MIIFPTNGDPHMVHCTPIQDTRLHGDHARGRLSELHGGDEQRTLCLREYCRQWVIFGCVSGRCLGTLALAVRCAANTLNLFRAVAGSKADSRDIICRASNGTHASQGVTICIYRARFTCFCLRKRHGSRAPIHVIVGRRLRLFVIGREAQKPPQYITVLIWN